MAELHEFALLVATSPQAARARGKRALLRGALQRHMDDLRVIQTLANGLHVHLHAPVGARDGGSGGVEDIQLLIPSWFGYKRID